MMLSIFKKLLEEGNLIIHDKHTVEELFTFIEKPNGTFSAEDGSHDDLIMALVLFTAPMFDVKNWTDFKGFSTILENRLKEEKREQEDTVKFLNLGFSNNDIQETTPFTEELWGESNISPQEYYDMNN